MILLSSCTFVRTVFWERGVLCVFACLCLYVDFTYDSDAIVYEELVDVVDD